MLKQTYLENLILSVPKRIKKTNISRIGKLTIELRRVEDILPFFFFNRDHSSCKIKILIKITAVDFPNRIENRFEVVYHLLSVQYNTRLRIKLLTNEINAVPSIEQIYSAAGWFEREVWDLFGIFFSNNSDLRRILTDYGFEGHPLRKDFPLSGYVEARFDESEKRIVLETVEITQEFRFFEFANPWKSSSVII
jgi:NADH/F420H2 dehydrogenase subunit C